MQAIRLKKGEEYADVKTYMAHHQVLYSFLSINNLINNNILPERFMANPEMEKPLQIYYCKKECQRV